MGDYRVSNVLAKHVIKATEPTLLGSNTFWNLNPIDLLHGFPVDTAYVIPSSIDIDRFNDALAKTLSIFPLASGRLEYPSKVGESWRVRLSNTGVPVTVFESQADHVFPTRNIIQGSSLNTVERIDTKTLFSPHSNETPLVKITIILFPKIGCASIGLSIAHVIGDGYNSHQFARFLSQNYQGLPPLDDLPSYIPQPHYARSEKYQSMWRPAIEPPSSSPSSSSGPSREKPFRLTFRLSAKQVRELHEGVTKLRVNGDTRTDGSDDRTSSGPISLSRQDTLGAVIAKCYTKADTEAPPVQHISTCFMCRGSGPCPKTTPTNAVLITLTGPIQDPHHASLYEIASQIRRSVALTRDPDFVSSCVSHIQEIYLKHSNEGEMVDVTPLPGHLFMNSTWKFNWHSSHFGFPNKTEFYHTLMTKPRFVKIIQPNPYQLPDKTWISPSPNDGEITFCVPGRIKDRFEEVLRAEFREMGVEGEVEIDWTEC